MGITQSLLNLDGYFRSITGNKILVNDINFFDLEDSEKLKRALMTVYGNDDTISSKPTCDCGKLTGSYMLDRLCSYCGTPCVEPHNNITPILWIKAIKPEYRFLNPILWLIISNLMSKNIDYLRYLCDTRYNPPVEIPSYILGIKQFLNNVRTYENTMNNLRNIMVYLKTVPKFKNSDKKTDIDLIIRLLDENPDKVFATYIPVINKKLFVVEETTKGKFVNLISADIIDAVRTWSKLCTDTDRTDRAISNTMGYIMSTLSRLYTNYIKQYLIKKTGILRKHVYGSRSHFTFRCVIVSIPGQHWHDEVIAPWAVGVSAFRPHIMNILVNKRGYTFKQANAALHRSVKKYDPVIHDILNELIANSKYKGIPVLVFRNPELKQGSTQLVYITGFTTDPMNFTAKISVLICKAPNADLDGDECNFTILLDNDLAEEFKTLSPYFNVPTESNVYGISGNLTLFSPSNSILSSFIQSKDSNGDDKVLNKFKFKEM